MSMIQIEMEKEGGGVITYPAARVLAHVNVNESIFSLNAMEWNKDRAKIDFLMGKSQAIYAHVAKPLTEAEALQALEEYKDYMGR